MPGKRKGKWKGKRDGGSSKKKYKTVEGPRATPLTAEQISAFKERSKLNLDPALYAFPEITEEYLGIEQFRNDHKGFTGVVKQRYSDFMVNEVDPDGKVVHLTNTELPFTATEDVSRKTEELQALFGDTVAAELEAFSVRMRAYRDALKGHEKLDNRSESQIYTFPFMAEKASRTTVHKMIRKHYGDLLETRAAENGEGGIRALVARKGHEKKMWPQDRPKVLKFVLFKKNCDTMSAISQIAQACNIQTKQFSYAGTKDRRAVTAQNITGYMVDADRLVSSLKRKQLDTVRGGTFLKIGNFEYVEEKLKLGSLYGNRFTLIIRHVGAAVEDCVPGLEAVLKHGFINYFGTQRFGTHSTPTHAIGIAALQGRFDRVIGLLLSPGKQDKDQERKAKEYFAETRDALGAYHMMPRWCNLERTILAGLHEHGLNSFHPAFNKISRNMRLLYCHATQSYIWNKMVSYRVSTFGPAPIEGDLVWNGPKLAKRHNYTDAEYLSKMKNGVKALTAEDIAAKTYTLRDIVMPLPGVSVTYPANAMAAKYQELFKELKIDFDNLSAKFGKEMHLVGDYRPILAIPEDMQWEFGTYDDIEIPFTADDWTLLQQQQGVSPDTPIIEKKEVSLQDESSIGKFLGIKVSFTLPSSCYATMMIRELTKESSKKTHQVTMYNAEQTRVLGPGWQEEEAKAKALLAEQAAAAIEAEAAAVAVAASTVPTKMDTTAN